MAKKTFQHGHKKVGGKVKGTKNKKTLILDSFAKNIIEGGMEKFNRELNKLRGATYIKAYMTLFEYVKPKLARTELTGKDGTSLAPINYITADEATKKGLLNLKKGNATKGN
jgi:hypothetical protein